MESNCRKLVSACVQLGKSNRSPRRGRSLGGPAAGRAGAVRGCGARRSGPREAAAAAPPPRRVAQLRALTTSPPCRVRPVSPPPPTPCPRPQGCSPPPSSVFSPRRRTSKRGSSARRRRAARSPPAANSSGGRPPAPLTVSGGPSAPLRGPRCRGGGAGAPRRARLGGARAPSAGGAARRGVAPGRRLRGSEDARPRREGQRGARAPPRLQARTIARRQRESRPPPGPPKSIALSAPFSYPQRRPGVYFYFLGFDPSPRP